MRSGSDSPWVHVNKIGHVVIIPDGNRRWAKKKGLAAFLGHEKGAEKLQETLEAALELEIPYFTFWGSSLDNITKRPKEEVDFLFGVFEKYFKKLVASEKIYENEARISILGRWRELFPENLKNLFEEAMEKTKNFRRHCLTFLMAYSGVDEMTNAIQGIAQLSAEGGSATSGKTRNLKLEINPKLIKDNLWTNELPPVNLVIRTGGEPHWSAGFMMWDVSDAQLYFTETMWPDFGAEEFRKAVDNYSKTERRFGQ